jgi:lysozyme
MAGLLSLGMVSNMAVFKVTAPDGKILKVSGPDGSTADQAISMAQSMYKQAREVMSNVSKSISSNGLGLIKAAEKFSPKPYMDTNGKLSVGYGTQFEGLHADDEVSPEQADGLLHDHLNSEVLPWIHKNVKHDLNQNQIDALSSLIYNVGTGAFEKSRAFKALNAGDLDTFKREAFSRDRGFVKANGRTLAGLVGRRNKEMSLFDGEAVQV